MNNYAWGKYLKAGDQTQDYIEYAGSVSANACR